MFETFARNPEEYDRVRQDPGLVPMAIEEHLRFSSPIQNLYRYTRADYDIAGVTIPRGSRVLLSFGAANRDPEAFEEPDTYRADRTPTSPDGFDDVAHPGAGAPIARMGAPFDPT